MAKFWPQMAKFWPSQNIPGIYTMIFSKKIKSVVSIPKFMKIYSGVWKPKHSKMAIFWAFWGSKKFLTKKIFGGHLCHMETQLHAKNRKKY